MKSIPFEEAKIKIAEHQKEFNTVHAQFNPKEGSVNMCFELSDEDIAQLTKTKKIWYKQVNYGEPMHPMRLSAIKEEIIY